MEAFEQWWQRQGSRIQKLSISMNNPDGKTYKEGTKDGWQAALEWAHTRPCLDIHTDIQKELEN